MLMHYRTTVRLNWFLCALFFYRSIKWTCKYFRSAFCQARPCSISIFVTAWRKLAAALTQFCAAHDTRELKIFWDERADWWPQFHFRLSLVPNKDHVSELEWKLTRYKAEAARWLHDKVRVLCVHIQAFHCAFHNHSCLEFGENLTDRKTLQSYKLNYFIKQRVIILIKSDS